MERLFVSFRRVLEQRVGSRLSLARIETRVYRETALSLVPMGLSGNVVIAAIDIAFQVSDSSPVLFRVPKVIVGIETESKSGEPE